MKAREIFNEWIPVASLPKANVNWDAAIHFGEITTSDGIHEIVQLQSGNEILFGVSVEDQVVAYLGLLRTNTPNLFWSKNAFTESAWRRRGLITALFDYLGIAHGFQFLSDKELTADGETLTNSLKKYSKLTFEIIDISTDKRYPVGDAGKVIDGKEILDPKNDQRPPHEQNFFYLLSYQPQKIVRESLEKFNPPFDQPNTLLADYIRFGPDLDQQ